MKHALDMFGYAVLACGLVGLAALSFALAVYLLSEAWRAVGRRMKGTPLFAKALTLLACGIVGYWAGSKPTVSVSDPYVRDVGSYVTNDLVHVALERRYDFVPLSTEVLIWYRELSSTDVEDWVQLMRIEEGPYRLGEFPLDIPFPNATNYVFMVAARYVPEPTVHTNGVWSMKGFMIPGTQKAAFPNTKIITEEMP